MSKNARIARLRVLKKRTGQRVVVELENGEGIEVDPEIVVRRGLERGAPLDRDTVDSLRREDEVYRARRRLIHYLTLRVKSVADARHYLEKAGFGEAAVDRALDHARERDLLDDRRFAERFVRTRLKMTTLGPLRLLAELLSHGIEEGLAREVLQPQFDYEWQRREAAKIAAKRNADTGAAADLKARKKRFDMLQRRGFEAEIARQVARWDPTEEGLEK